VLYESSAHLLHRGTHPAGHCSNGPAQLVVKAEALLKKIADGIADDWTAYTHGGERFPADGMAVMSPERAANMGELNAVRRAVADHIVMLQEALN
jgi:hypothetical protein